MMKKIIVILMMLPLLAFAQNHSDKVVKKNRPSALNNGKFFSEDGKKMLYGGSSESQHFDITDISLKEEQFHYGLGREAFPALLEPEFNSVEKADEIWADDARFLVAYSGDEVKAYSVKDLTRHEIVNDVLNGEPIMAAYCILADLGAIYKRDYGGEVLTFGVSGYTYFDPEIWNGLDAFILWDRETESLWWPLVEKAVSGPLKEVKLMEMDKSNWKDVTWKYIKETYPKAQVLKSNQDFERPKGWDKKVDISEIKKNYR
ncbi:DUF3179 domain-containing (seleno)protein [Rasiella sp. SM2506]|uniref:DUF3179 domain-containing (seleno)protein n=1 Tax=Rasiella sp. SM2506 TaxID=3423914 RepID=UPI003D7B9BDD